MSATDDLDVRLAGVAALGDPVRRQLYLFVVAQPEPVGRDRAAAGVGVARHVAKFHLDRLAGDGLLDTEFSRPPGRSGPGAGRPAKLYRRSAREIEVTLPERHYDLVARLMAEAIESAEQSGEAVSAALRRSARAAGHGLGRETQQAVGSRPSQAAAVGAVSETLRGYGYEPQVSGTDIRLANCPFHQLAQTHTELVCGMNLDLVEGLLDALDQPRLRARLDPAPGRCCVAIGR